MPPALLLTNAQLLNNCAVALEIFAHEIVEQAAPLADQLQKAAARGKILGMALQVLGQRINAVREDGNLDFRPARVVFVGAVLANQFALEFLADHVLWSPL